MLLCKVLPINLPKKKPAPPELVQKGLEGILNKYDGTTASPNWGYAALLATGMFALAGLPAYIP